MLSCLPVPLQLAVDAIDPVITVGPILRRANSAGGTSNVALE